MCRKREVRVDAVKHTTLQCGERCQVVDRKGECLVREEIATPMKLLQLQARRCDGDLVGDREEREALRARDTHPHRPSDKCKSFDVCWEGER